MGGLSLGRLRPWLTVLAAIGVLVVAGRLLSAGLQPASAPLGGDVFAPARLVRGGVEFAEPISGLAVTRAAVWVAHGTTIERLDPGSLHATASLQVPAIVTGSVEGPIRGLAAIADEVWASVPGGLLRIDAATGRIVAFVSVVSVAPPALSDKGVWVVCCGGETYLGGAELIRVDPATNRVVSRVSLPGLPDAVGVGDSGVWVRAAAGPVWRVDPATNRVVATVLVPHGLGGTRGNVLVGRDAVWVSDPASGTVMRIDPRSNRIAGLVDVAGPPLAAAADGTVVATSRGRVLTLGPGSVRGVHVDGINGEYATGLAEVGGTIWIAESGVLLRVDQLG